MKKIPFLLGLVLALILCSISINAQAKKRIAYWTFDDSTARDYSGNGYHGRMINNPTPVQGISGAALQFQGNGYYIVDREPDYQNKIPGIGDHVLFPNINLVQYEHFIISLWVKELGYSWRHGGAYIWYGHHNYGWLGVFNHIHYLSPNDTILYINFGINARLFSDIVSFLYDYNNRNNWVHYEIEYNKGVMTAFVNGAVVGKINTVIKPLYQRFSLGRHWWTYDGEERTASRFTGIIDEVEIYTFDDRPTVSGLTSFCENDSTRLCGSVGFSKYKWSNGDNQQCIWIKKSGKYWYQAEVGGETYYSDTVAVSIIPTPEINIYSTSYCITDTLHLQCNTNSTNVSWSNGVKGKTNIINKPGTYIATVSDSYCLAYDTITIYKDSILIYRGDKPCLGDPYPLFVDSIYQNCTWSTGESGHRIEVFKPGRYSVKATGKGGCEVTAFVDIDFLSELDPKIIVPPVLCKEEPAKLTLDQNYSTYSWSNGSTNKDVTVYRDTVLFVKVTNEFGCKGYDTVSITFNDKPEPKIIVPDSVCEGEPVKILLNKKFKSYKWSTGEKTEDITVTTGSSISVEVTDSTGCVGKDTEFLKFRKNPEISISGPDTVCLDNIGIYTISSNSKNNKVNVTNGELIKEDGDKINILWNKQGEGKVLISVINEFGCKGFDTINVAVLVNPLHPKLITNAKTSCDLPAKIKAPGGYDEYHWSNGEQGVTEITAVEPGKYFVIVKLGEACEGSSDTVEIIKRDPPTPKIIGQSYICKDSSAYLDLDKEYSSYEWNNGDSAKGISVDKPGTYSCTVTDSYGCKGTAIFTLEAGDNISFIEDSVLDFGICNLYRTECKKVKVRNNSDIRFIIPDAYFFKHINFSIPYNQFPIVFEPKEEKLLEICFYSNYEGLFQDTLWTSHLCNPIVVKAIAELPAFDLESPCGSTIVSVDSSLALSISGPYPNPGKEKVAIEAVAKGDKAETPLIIEVSDVQGNILQRGIFEMRRKSEKHLSAEAAMDFEGYNDGVYFIKISYGGEVKTLKYMLLK